MRITDLRIENFRGVRSGSVRFGIHTVLIGANNCGKTTVIEALALLFGRDKLVRSLTEHDFFGSNPQASDRIRLIATVSDFDGDDPADFEEWFRLDRAVPKWLDLTGELHAQRVDQGWRLACQVAFAARFDRPSLEVDTARYFHDDDNIRDIFNEESWTQVPSRLIRDLGLFLIPANRTWDRIISFGSELFRRVVASGGGPPAEAVLVERDRLRQPTVALEADANLSPIVDDVNRELAGFFRSAPSLLLRLTSTDSEGVLEAVVPHYRHRDQDQSLPAKRQGSGLVSLQWLLLLLQFGRRRASAGEGFWMALEEPELHVPPALQRRLVYRLQALSTQTIVSTHSPMVAAMADPTSLSLLRNDGGVLSSTPFLARSLPLDTPNSIRKLFQLNRIDTIAALMHEIILIPEGRTDVDWLRVLLRALDSSHTWSGDMECHFDSHVGLISTHDAAVVATYQALCGLHPKAMCLVDGDLEGLRYLESLIALPNPPAVAARWPDGWTIESVVGWIMQANEAEIMATNSLAESIVPRPTSIADLLTRLKSTDRSAGGLKGDQLAYESVADSVAGVPECLARARELLNGLGDFLAGVGSQRFRAVERACTVVGIFQP